MNSNQQQLRGLIQRYRPLGIVKGNELLLSPKDALYFANDLKAIDISIMGVDGWHFVDKSKGWIVQDLTVEFGVDEDILQMENASEKSVEQVTKFLEQLEERIDFVSFILDIPSSWEIV